MIHNTDLTLSLMAIQVHIFFQFIAVTKQSCDSCVSLSVQLCYFYFNKNDRSRRWISGNNPGCKAKRILKIEDSLKDFGNNIKCTNTHIIGVLEGEEIEKGAENFLRK